MRIGYSLFTDTPGQWRKAKTRFLILCLLLSCFLFSILLRLFDLQIRQHKKLSASAIRQQQKQIPLPSRRGSICDRNGRELAVSLRCYSIFAHPSLVQDASRAASRLADFLDLSAREVFRKLRSGKPFVWIKRKVDPEMAKAILDSGLPGIFAIEEEKRYYPKRDLGSHVLGFVGLDDQGLEGLELSYDSYLKGSHHPPLGYCDALGRIAFREAEADASWGCCDIILTLDEVIQYIAERALEKGVESSQAKGGSIIVMEPATGEILALANRPTFDLTRYQDYPPAFRRNRAISDCYEPGSTFKVILAAGALEEGVVTPGERIYCERGGISLNGFYIRDYKKYGWLTFSQVLTNSSNVGAIKTAMKLGKEKYYEYIRRFGFGEKTGIELPGEARGILRRPQDWSSISLGALAIGQEVSVTPLQLLSAFAAIANGGKLMRPSVVKCIRSPEGERIWENSPQVVRQVVSPATCSALTQILTKVVEDGTGQKAAVPGYVVAGKTGTSQKIDGKKGAYSHHKVVASFVGFVPSQSPRVAILVTIDEPKVGSWGGTLAAPIFAQVAQETMAYLSARSGIESDLSPGLKGQ